MADAARLTALAEDLSGVGLAARVLPALGMLSLFADDEYENYDYEVVMPSARSTLKLVAEKQGWRAKGARRFDDPESGVTLRFPRPAGTLGTSPADRVQEELEGRKDNAFVVVTATQAILVAFEQGRHEELSEELTTLVSEQPANLEKVEDWLSAGAATEGWKTLLTPLLRAQREGIERRRRRRGK